MSSTNSHARYRRVSQVDEDNSSTTSDSTSTADARNASEKKKRAERIEKITSKMHALFWVLMAVGLIQFTDMFSLLGDPKLTNRYALNVACLSFAVVIGIFLYLALYLPMVKRVTIPWDIYCPHMVPAATISSLVCYISLVVTFWPSWGLLSPLFVGLLFMGAIFSAHFIPWPC